MKTSTRTSASPATAKGRSRRSTTLGPALFGAARVEDDRVRVLSR